MELPLKPNGQIASDEGPLQLFQSWFAEAAEREPNDPGAMALATSDSAGLPNVRMVLLKSLDARGFIFFSHLESTKGVELSATPKAAAVFHWKSLARQVRVRGLVELWENSKVEEYFATRPRLSQISAWASKQSRPLEHPDALKAAVAEGEARFAFTDVPRPPHWAGYRIIPLQIEFWSSRAFRLHERVLFRRDSAEANWAQTQLYP